MGEFKHYSVMLNETVDMLDVREDGVYVDCTLGGGGHSEQIARKLTTGKLICIDRDTDAIEAAKKRLSPYSERIIFVNDNFKNIRYILDSLGIDSVDGITADLGVSSYQLDTPERGFSYMADAPLDMRMNTDAPLTAYDVVNEYSEAELKRIIYEYGEDRFAGRIAAKIVSAREQSPINTTGELVQVIRCAVPAAMRDGGSHPAKRTFQAIRIEVNKELNVIAPAVRSAVELLDGGGRIAIITFHSLEDRIVKQEFVKYSKGCTCPKDFPVCVCGNKPKLKVITGKPILPSKEELEENSRSHSAKLRVAEKI